MQLEKLASASAATSAVAGAASLAATQPRVNVSAVRAKGVRQWYSPGGSVEVEPGECAGMCYDSPT